MDSDVESWRTGGKSILPITTTFRKKFSDKKKSARVQLRRATSNTKSEMTIASQTINAASVDKIYIKFKKEI